MSNSLFTRRRGLKGTLSKYFETSEKRAYRFRQRQQEVAATFFQMGQTLYTRDEKLRQLILRGIQGKGQPRSDRPGKDLDPGDTGNPVISPRPNRPPSTLSTSAQLPASSRQTVRAVARPS